MKQVLVRPFQVEVCVEHRELRERPRSSRVSVRVDQLRISYEEDMVWFGIDVPTFPGVPSTSSDRVLEDGNLTPSHDPYPYYNQ